MSNKNDDYRKQWIDVIQESSKQYDRTIILISSGAIGLSLTFINSILPKGIINPIFLFISWGGFAGAILFNIFSHITSIEGYKANIDELDHGKTPNKCWSVLTNALNYLTLGSFFIGIMFLCIFGYFNIK